jgi:hypothetical protein
MSAFQAANGESLATLAAPVVERGAGFGAVTGSPPVTFLAVTDKEV